MPRHDPPPPRGPATWKRTDWRGSNDDPRIRMIEEALERAEDAIEAAIYARDELLLQLMEVHSTLPRATRRRPPPLPPRRKPPEAGVPVPAMPPKGPLPKQGGAEAPLDFD